MTATQNSTTAKTNLAMLQNRLSSGATDLSIDPSTPTFNCLPG